ncbi:ImmA/IrrE family metallo-endopeptidase [Rosenbergiella sp. S61]|uniref:ImmA/IrrE family metallo-endopeptidase n=1 Tax=Rosenbergiella gaditana TaxID=2726987 RepID=A0ABS5SYF2_9GAMM|nr:XRE family transcriptional regulator [Rosenbergiella gaditana]MBT0725131.1 ImmA/IrrE family metallo-endopeptidase [Rosenbergiella gaditana]
MRVGITGFEPGRLTQIREARGLSKINLGRLVERSPSTITKWENGNHSPDAESLMVLSETLNCPISWFTKPLMPRDPKPVFFRTLASTAKDLINTADQYMGWLQETSFLLQEYLEFPELNIPSIDVDDHRAIDDQLIEKVAQKCREKWDLGIGPIKNLLLTIENAGIICSQFEQGSAVMDGYSQWNEIENKPYIILATDKNNYYRSRFDAAHELGHIVLHRHINKLDLNNLKSIEDQANKFAACFMLPEESFTVELPPYPTIEDFVSLKSRWGMSAQAMIYRAKSLELISPLEYQRIYKSVSARGWRKGEPLDDLTAPETVKLLPRSVKLLLDEGIFTKAGLLETLGMARSDVEDLLSLPRSFLKDSSVKNLNSLVTIKSTNKTQYQNDSDKVVNLFGSKD